MSEAIAPTASAQPVTALGHRRWVRVCHWTIALAFLILSISGYLILMVHPRLYWGEVGNDLTPALIELPISGNHQPAGWQRMVDFGDAGNGSFSADRTYQIFNQNGWARSLHFLAAWFFVIGGASYLLTALTSGHLRRNLLPGWRELKPAVLREDIVRHLKRQFANRGGGPPYGVLQRVSYLLVVWLLLPLMFLTGMTMAPAITAAYPILLDVFGGYQSARTVHFFGFATLALFLIVHLVMVAMTGFKQQLRAMTFGPGHQEGTDE